jgi:FdhE protein
VTVTARDGWLTRHPYLQPVADVCALVEAAAARMPVFEIAPVQWQAYLDDFQAGVPLLQSESAAVDMADPVSVVLAMLDLLNELPAPSSLAPRFRALSANLRAQPEPLPGAEAGLFRVLLWAVLRRQLRPVVAAFGRWRDEERWLRSYCPTCGEPPAMAQLVGTDPGRLRLLSCGCCQTRWRYRRTGCPFCEAADDHRLAVIAVEGQSDLRIDACETCGAYLKTYVGQGQEDVLLADWTSLHLDFVARDRGLKRIAGSLYSI